MCKVTYILSDIDRAIAFEWIVEGLSREDVSLSFILLNSSDSYIEKWLRERKIPCYFIRIKTKKDIISGFFKVIRILRKIKPDIVHSHLFKANLVGLSAAWILRIKKRIYTRHHSTFHQDYHPEAVKWDKLANFLATDVIAISGNVRNTLISNEHVSPQKIQLIPHGFDLRAFEDASHTDLLEIKSKYNLVENDSPVVGVVARFIRWKGIQYIIPAFKKFLNPYPNAVLILANANGPDKSFLEELLKHQIPSKNYREIGFEKDLFLLYKMFDLYIHVPIDNKIEAFGQTYVESLAAGVPGIFTLSGIANDFIQDRKNALVVNYKNSDEIFDAMLTLMTNEQLKKSLINEGRNSVKQFDLPIFINNLNALYAG